MESHFNVGQFGAWCVLANLLWDTHSLFQPQYLHYNHVLQIWQAGIPSWARSQDRAGS